MKKWIKDAYTRITESHSYDAALLAEAATRYEKLRKLNPRQFSKLHERSLNGENFHDLVDGLEG